MFVSFAFFMIKSLNSEFKRSLYHIQAELSDGNRATPIFNILLGS